ncbi:extracellular solute-binding protein [Microbacteriaceae bacterium VKM Ac-2854]|nr:extracellular solute-binding protein [Microbacteriaceae bacterium VKM Ac-2854]
MFRNRKMRAALAAAAIASSAAIVLSGCSGGGAGETAATYDPDEKVTLTLAFWGNDVRADLYNKAIAAFNEEYPNITVNSSFLGFPEFWEKRQTEAAGGGLPDVMQFDYSYLRQYSDNNLLLDLDPYLGNVIETDGLEQNVLDIGVVDDTTTALPIGTNAWALFENPALLESAGVKAFPGGSWEDYNAWVTDYTAAAKAAGIDGVWGGNDYTFRIQNFEIEQRADGKDLFTEDGEPNFTEKDLAAFWEQGADVRESGAVISQQRLTELNPLGGFDAGAIASELSWDNFGAGYVGNLGEGSSVTLQEPPVTDEGAKDLYLKPAMMHAISAKTDHPEAAATLVNFLVNDPKAGEIFGTSRGLPASSTALEGASLDTLGQAISDYEDSIADRLGDAPPVPITGYGTLEEKFRQIGIELGFGTLTVDEAVEQFFTEMDVVLNQ